MTNPNDVAFPTDRIFPGLTKREWFAGMAVQGLASNLLHYDHVAITAAVTIADILIEELNKNDTK